MFESVVVTVIRTFALINSSVSSVASHKANV